MILMVFMLGGAIGLSIHYYCTHFAKNISLEIYQAYCELYPQHLPRIKPNQSSLKAIKCGHFLWYFFIFACFFGLCFSSMVNPKLGLLFALYCALIFTISLLDWHYHLIPLALCQQLIVLAIIGSYTQILSISLIQSLQNIGFSFMLFFFIYYLAKYYYKREAFGRGDYWLIAGLAGFIPWQDLSMMIFTACLSALGYISFLKLQQQHIEYIPFAPFLNLAGLFTFWINNVSINSIYLS